MQVRIAASDELSSGSLGRTDSSRPQGFRLRPVCGISGSSGFLLLRVKSDCDIQEFRYHKTEAVWNVLNCCGNSVSPPNLALTQGDGCETECRTSKE